MNKKVCSFTGHRIIENTYEVKEKLKKLIIELIEDGYLEFYNGGAIGFDFLSAITVIELKKEYDIKLNLILPCKNQDIKWNNYNKKIYRYIIDNCDSLEYISEEYNNFCMHQRNRALCERCDLLVAYLKRNYGGTYYTVEYAKKTGKRLINIT